MHPRPTPKPASGPTAGNDRSFAKNEDAKSSVIFAVAGLTITMGGLLAWFVTGTVMMGLSKTPGIGPTLGLVGFLTVVGVLAILGLVAYTRGVRA